MEVKANTKTSEAKASENITLEALYSDGQYATSDGYVYKGEYLDVPDGYTLKITLDNNGTKTREDDIYLYSDIDNSLKTSRSEYEYKYSKK